jgi:hypothetical protein
MCSGSNPEYYVKIKNLRINLRFFILAEEEGFEPSLELAPH